QVMKNTEDIKLLQDSFAKFEEKRKSSEIYFNGQIYDAYSKICEIFNEAKKKLIIIDNYADRFLLDMIKNLNTRVVLVTQKNKLLSNQDIFKYNKQYYNLKVIYNDTFHDRYFILDDSEIYHCGASVNRIGHKIFSVTRINDGEVIGSLLDKVKKLLS
ncbi:MAG: ORF6N domain-containing protein, partial [Candidatus Saccharibacteria bacterium]|nr:ORF6N domain-containing protein [Candidatus Saccharibacteria bacterium]